MRWSIKISDGDIKIDIGERSISVMIETQLLQHKVALPEYVSACVDMKKFIKFCRACPEYGNNWSCPPFNFSPYEIWQSYKSILLYGKKIILGEELTSERYEADELNAVVYKIYTPVKHFIAEKLQEMEIEYPDSMALFAGKCDGCETCNRPTGQACIKPELMRHSIEGLGGDVEKTLKLYFGESLAWPSSDRLPQHLLLIGGLLLK